MSLAPMEELCRHRVCKILMKKGLLSAERVKLMESWEHSGFNIDASVRIGADDAQPLGPIPIPLSDDIDAAKTARGNWARFIKKVFELDPLLCPDCGGVMKITSFIEDPRVIRAILLNLSLWDVPRARPPPVAPVVPVDFEYLPCVD